MSPTFPQLLEALENARSVERRLSEIARAAIDPDDDDAVMAATNAMVDRAYQNIVGRIAFDRAGFVAKAKAIKIMDDATGGALFQSPNEHDEALLRQIVGWLAAEEIAP